MKVEELDGKTHVWLRQSWIGDAVMCPERGRQGVVRPEWNITSDSAALGTAVHRGIEVALSGGEDPFRSARAEMERLLAEPMKRTLKMTDGALITKADALVHLWDRELAPLLVSETILGLEEKFDFEWCEIELFGRTVVIHLTGTIDCLTTTKVWDWKTTGSRKYSAHDKQKQAVQPTVYLGAAVHLGHLEWPAIFNYAVMFRDSPKTQVLPIHRSQNHMAWLLRLVRPFIAQAIGLGFDSAWPLNDTGFLCSSTWCPWWSMCKGADLAPADLSPKE